MVIPKDFKGTSNYNHHYVCQNAEELKQTHRRTSFLTRHAIAIETKNSKGRVSLTVFYDDEYPSAYIRATLNGHPNALKVSYKIFL